MKIFTGTFKRNKFLSTAFAARLVVMVVLCLGAEKSSGQLTHLVISQFYPGGGNASATYNTKFLEIFNPTGSSVSLSGWAVTYVNSSGTVNKVNITGSPSVAANKYFLIQLGTGTTGAALPVSVDLTISNSPAASNGTIIIQNNQIAPTSGTSSQIVDMLAWGAPASGWVETSPVSAPISVNALYRGNGGCIDVNNNSSDFSSSAVSPRNSSSAANVCPSVPTVITDATPGSLSATSATLGGNVIATGGASINGNGTVYALTATNSTPAIGGSGVTQLGTASPGSGTGAFSNPTVAALAINTQYSYRAYATNSVGTAYGGGIGTTFYTLANMPTAPTVNNPTSISLDLAVNSNGNPAITQFALQETTGGQYVQANGSLGASAVWQTTATWGTKTVTGLNASTSYTFQVKARNGANVETAYSTTASGTTLAATPTILTSGALAALSSTYGTVSSNTSFSVSGSYLTGDINIAAPVGFEVSTSAGSGFNATLNLPPISGTVPSTTIYVRLAATTVPGTYSGNIDIISTGATPVSVATVPSTVATKQLTITGITIPLSKTYDATTISAITGTAALQAPVAAGAGTTNDGRPVTGDDISLTGTATGNYNSKNVATATTVAISGLSLTGAQASYYILSQGTGAATITPKALTMSGLTVPASKVYDGSTAAIVSGTPALQAAIAQGTGTSGDGKPYTGDAVSITGTATGTYNSPNVATATTVTFGGLSLTGSQSGNYTLTVQSPASATITKANQTITFSALPVKTTADADFSPGATSASSGVNPVTYASANTSVATIVSSNIHIVGAGNSVITASQASSANYNAATDVSQTLTVTQASSNLGNYLFSGTLAISAPNAGLTYTNVIPNTVTGTTSSSYYNLSVSGGWGTGLNTNNYIQFSVTPQAQKLLTATSITFLQLATGAGATNFVVRSSADNYGSNLGAGVYSSDISSGAPTTQSTVSLSGILFTDIFNTVTFRIYPYGGGGSGNWRIDNLTLNGYVNDCSGTYPTITAQPATQSICSGAALNLSVTATSATAYQWRKGGINISGATSSSYSISPVATSDAGNYDVLITGSAACAIVTSNTAVVTVNQAPTAITISPAAATICNGSIQQLVAGGGEVTKTLSAGTASANSTTTGYPSPFSVYFGGSRQQFIVLASELTNAGFVNGSSISSIAFNVQALGGSSLAQQNFKVKIGHTTATAMTSTFINTASTPVFGPATYPATGTVSVGLNTINFSSSFIWNGSSNIFIETTFSNNTAGVAANGISAFTHLPGGTLAAYFRDDSQTAAAIEATTTATSTSTSRPDFVLSGTAQGEVTWLANTTSLFIDAGATTPYTNQITNTVYAKPTTTQTYTASVTSNTCTVTKNVTVTVNPVPVITTQPSSTTACSGGISSFSAVAVGSSYQWQVSTDGGVTYSNIVNGATYSGATTLNLAILNVSGLNGNHYRIVVTGLVPCGTVTSDGTATLTIQNTWTGTVNTDWNNGLNWSCAVSPSSNDNVIIPAVLLLPHLTTATSVKDISFTGSSNISLDDQTLTILGAVNGSGVLTGSAASSLIISGAAGTIHMDSSFAANRSLNNLTLMAGSSATIGNATDIYGAITLTTASLNLASKEITLKSNINGTARIADLTGSTLSNADHVTVERYIGAATPKAAWRLLTAPLRSTTASNGLIYKFWQNSGLNTAGTGTQVTGPGGASATTGIDAYTVRPSVQYFDHTIDQNLHGVTDTKTTGTATPLFTTATSAANKSYFIFTRGDRSVNPGDAANNTTFRPAGTLQTGDQTFTTAAANADDNTLVGNPYAAPVDLNLFRLANTGSNVKTTYYYWDPYLTGTYGVGGYVTVSYDGIGTETITPAGASHTRFLQSGQAMFLERTASGAGTASVTFKENQKGATNAPVFLVPGTRPDSLAVNLHVLLNNTPVLIDGAITAFDSDYAAATDDYDATKFPNIGESISFKRNGKTLAIERRQPVAMRDTLFLDMSNMKAGSSYRFEFAPGFAMPGFIAFLQDSYVPGSNYPLSTTAATVFDFTVTANAATAVANRFRIVFAGIGPLAVSFKTVKAYEQGRNINVDWKVENELDMQQYEVERSVDGSSFTKMNTTAALNQTSSSYTWTDISPVSGYNFYRIRSIALGGEIKYSNIVKVLIGKGTAGISIYPNPVQNGIVNLQMNSMPAGAYNMRLINSIGQVVQTMEIKHAAGNSTETMPLSSRLPAGTYSLEIIDPGNNRTNIKIVF